MCVLFVGHHSVCYLSVWRDGGLVAGPAPARRNSFVGTAQYVSPEILTNSGSSKASDLWALGCIIYQMVTGIPPFQAQNEYLIFQKVTKQTIRRTLGIYFSF